MRAVILQPAYIPWLGFFNQMLFADLFIYLDDVQFDKRGWRNRNRIKGPNGPVWLTVPILSKGSYKQTLTETRIDNSGTWFEKHLKAIQRNYAKSKFFKSYYVELEAVMHKKWDYIVDLDYALTELIRGWLGITTPIVRASEIKVENPDKTGRLVEACVKTNATEYISGPLCTDYLDSNQFTNADIRVWLHEYHHPEYFQRFPPFEPYLSCLDLVFNEGPGSLEILRDDSALTPLE